MDKVNFVVVGIGLNVNNDKRSLTSGSTSLKEQKKEHICRLGLLAEILQKLENNYLLFQKKGSRPIIEKWREYNITLGERVKVYAQNGHFEGQAQEIDSDGALLLRCDQGLVRRVTAGDVVFCR
jgi:BirA family biotin operon repressor/biotin-[acetyl-CoA-carboxylase] ligase